MKNQNAVKQLIIAVIIQIVLITVFTVAAVFMLNQEFIALKPITFMAPLVIGVSAVNALALMFVYKD